VAPVAPGASSTAEAVLVPMAIAEIVPLV